MYYFPVYLRAEFICIQNKTINHHQQKFVLPVIQIVLTKQSPHLTASIRQAGNCTADAIISNRATKACDVYYECTRGTQRFVSTVRRGCRQKWVECLHSLFLLYVNLCKNVHLRTHNRTDRVYIKTRST